MAGTRLLQTRGHLRLDHDQLAPWWLGAALMLVVGVIGVVVMDGTGPTATGSSGPNPSWYSSAWRLRRPIVVENRAAQSLANYQVKVSLPSSFDFGDTTSTGNDIRFTDSDGTTPLDYWQEAFDPSRRTGTFWVKMSVLRAKSSKMIYVYYGNRTAPSNSDGRATFPLFDDFATPAWTSLPYMPISTADASAAVVQGKFYIIGGYDRTPDDPLGTNYEFDPRTNAYSPRSPIPTPRWGAIAVGVGTKVYVFGGTRHSEANPMAITEVYDTGTDSWTARAPVPRSLAQEGVTGCTDGVHVFLFANGVGYSYDVSTDRYSLLGAMPHYVGNWASCGYYEGKIFLIGGLSHDREVENTTQIYEIETRQWSIGSPMPFASYGSVRENPIVGNTMYILQGQREDGEFSSQVYAYDLSSNSWTSRSFGPHADDGVAGGVWNGEIFSFGGRQDVSGPYGLNYASVYDPSVDRNSAWRQITGGFELSGGGLRRMVPLRGSDNSAPRFSQLQTQYFHAAGDFVLEARTNQVETSREHSPKTSWSSIGIGTNPGNDASAVAGCQIPVIDDAMSPTPTLITVERGSVLTSLASTSSVTSGSVTHGVERSSGNSLLTENSRPVLNASDQSCRSGTGFVSIQTAGETDAYWSNLFVRAFSPIEPRVAFPG